jgi:hypothetical protein
MRIASQEDQADPLESASVIAAVSAAITAPRLATYLARTGGDRSLALKLYRHNLRLSGATYEVLAVVEVAFRNTVDTKLRAWNLTQADPSTGRPRSSAWLLDTPPLLRRLMGNDIRKAAHRAGLGLPASLSPSHDDILAQLNFGSWRYLLPDGDAGKQYLWGAALASAFPHLTGDLNRFIDRVDGIHRLRNRVAHLEPILGATVIRKQIRSIDFVLRAIDPNLDAWLHDTSRIDQVAAKSPLIADKLASTQSASNRQL